MIIYADVLFIQCFFCDFTVLYISSIILKNIKIKRIIGFSVISSLYSVIAIAYQIPLANLGGFACMVICSVFMFGYNKKEIPRRLIILLFVNTIFVGMVSYFGKSTNFGVLSGGRIYGVYSDDTFIYAGIISAFLTMLIYGVVSKKRVVYNIEIKKGVHTVKTTAYYDSCNMLEYMGNPVVIVDKEIANEFETEFYITGKGIGGEITMRGFVADELAFTDENSVIKNVYCAESGYGLSSKKDFYVLLNKRTII